MKRIKQLLTLLLAVLLVCSLTLPAFATQEGTLTGGSITIDNAVVGQTYNIYQILYLESYDADSGAYAYKANSAWETWLKTQTNYVSFDTQGYVTWVKNLTCEKTESDEHKHTDKCYTLADAAAFAKAAQEKAATMTTNDGTATATSATVTFNNLKLGYYLVDSTLGTLCSLDTTSPAVTIKEKNAVPTNEKKVEEDSKTGDAAWGNTNDADINQEVKFQSTITAQPGAENYVFHDKMSAGLTYGSVSGITLNGTSVATSNYTVKTTDLADDCTFEVVFTQAFCDTLKANDQIVISYTATVNNSAVVGLPGNPNESKLSYGDSSNTKYTTSSTTTTYVWDVDVLKYANGNEATVLAGVKFVLLNNDKTKVAKVEGGKLTGWETVPDAVNGVITWPTTSVLTTGADGKISIDGLDADTYYLREIEALPGYNILSGDKDFTVKGAETKDGKQTYETIVIKIENKSGTELPSTGGMGTTLFYVIGGTLVLAAVVLLVTKKRMKAEG